LTTRERKGLNMSRAKTLIAAVGVALLISCASQTQQLNQSQEAAMTTALRRGQFDLSCPSATPMLLSRTMLEPVAWQGTERAEYTVGVEGCGKKASYIVVCPETASGCLAAASKTNATVPQ
jgi:hypothetical protein